MSEHLDTNNRKRELQAKKVNEGKCITLSAFTNFFFLIWKIRLAFNLRNRRQKKHSKPEKIRRKNLTIYCDP